MSSEAETGAAECAVRPWCAGDTPAWDGYVRGHSRATFFHQIGWKEVLEETFGYPAHYLVAERDGSICGVLPVFACRSIRGALGLYSLPHTVYGGPVGDHALVEQALLRSAEELQARLGAGSIELRNRHKSLLGLPRVEGFVTFEKQLPATQEEVYRLFPKKAREAINQARKRHRLEVVEDQTLDRFYQLLADSYLSLGTPVFPRGMFQAMIDRFPDHTSVMVVLHEGTPVAAVLSAEFRDTIYPLYSGEAPGVRNLRSSNLKYFRLMEYAVGKGLTRFDFGRSRADNEGVIRFKINQGFEPELLPYEVKSATGESYTVSSPNQGMFRHARKVWRMLPRWCADRLGPRVVRYFP